MSVSELSAELERRIETFDGILKKNAKAIDKISKGVKRLGQEMLDTLINLREITNELNALVEAYESGNVSEDKVRLVFSWLISSVDQLILSGEILMQAVSLTNKAQEYTKKVTPLVQRARDYTFEP